MHTTRPVQQQVEFNTINRAPRSVVLLKLLVEVVDESQYCVHVLASSGIVLGRRRHESERSEGRHGGLERGHALSVQPAWEQKLVRGLKLVEQAT